MKPATDISMSRCKEYWESVLILPGERDLTSSAIRELREYFTQMSSREIERFFWQSGELLADHWRKLKVNPKSEESLRSFYNETELEIFELMHYHSEETDEGPLNYVVALELAKRFGCRTYMDYGSGIGSGGILFARNGLEVTLCDISTPLLEFAKRRFANRNLCANFIDLKTSRPSQTFDVVTCFEVLEHLRDPLATLREIHNDLREGGLLIVTAPFTLDEKRPMHIVHNGRLIDKFRGQGFHMRWDLKDPLRGKVREPFFIMQKVTRLRLTNKMYEIFDYYVSDSVKSAAYKLIKG